MCRRMKRKKNHSGTLNPGQIQEIMQKREFVRRVGRIFFLRESFLCCPFIFLLHGRGDLGALPHRNQVGGTGLGDYLEFGLCPLTSVKPRAVNWVSDPSLRNPEGRGRLAALGWKRREWPIPPELAGWDVRVSSMDHIRNAWKRGPVSWQESDHKGKDQFNNFPSPEDMIISSKVAPVLSPYLFSFSVTHHHHLFSILGWRKSWWGEGSRR